MRKKHHRQEKRMPTPELHQDEEITATVNQADMEASTANREAAALEERLAAERIAQARLNNEVSAPAEEQPAEPLISLAAKGRDALVARMRIHAEITRNAPSYVPPQRTERQMAQLELELEAGRKAAQRHIEQARPPAPVDHVKEGFTKPVYRPNDVVPDPKVAAPSGYAAGTKPYSPNV